MKVLPGGFVIADLKAALPGVALCVAVTAAAKLIEQAEVGYAGQLYLEGLVIAILLGVAIRAFWTPGTGLEGGHRVQRQGRCSRSRSCCSALRSAQAFLWRSGRSC
jgi:hypothetical protein